MAGTTYNPLNESATYLVTIYGHSVHFALIYNNHNTKILNS